MPQLSHLSAIRIEGQDALAFSQSLVTSDLSALGPDQWHPSAWCNAQGQVTVVMLVRGSEAGVDWVVPKSQAAITANTLLRYTIGRQVCIGPPQEVSGDWLSAEVDGSQASLSHAPDRVLMVAESAPTHLHDAAFEAAWRQADLNLGLAWLCPELSARFLPQSLGLERLAGMSYKKGCYPGQEVIAKVHYRGQVKQHLVLLELTPEPSPLLPEQALYPGGDQHGTGASKPCGVVIQQEGDRALAVVRATLETGTLLYTDPSDEVDARTQVGEIKDLPNLKTPSPVS
ncbi:MAG TPA: hypothetical protein VIC53_09785 [Wenzhouxiangella sp.]